METLPGVPVIADVPDEREEYEKSMARYIWEDKLHHQRIGQRYQIKEVNLIELLKKQKCERILAERIQTICQDLVDSGNIFLAVFPDGFMPRERAEYLGYLEDYHQGLVGFTAVKEDVTEKEISIKLELKAYQITLEIEHNYRQYNL